MRTFKVPSGAVTPNPTTSPGTIPDANIFTIPNTLPNTDEPPTILVLCVDPPTAVVECFVWLELEQESADGVMREPIPKAQRKWTRNGAKVTVTGPVREIVARAPAGPCYIEIATAVPGSTLFIGLI